MLEEIHTDPPLLPLGMKTGQLPVVSHIDPLLLQELEESHIHHCFAPAGRMTGLVPGVIHTHQCSALASECSDMNSQEPGVSHIPHPWLARARAPLQPGEEDEKKEI